jgi:gamma-glutamyltranspeptidase/glutathione hydrolase
VHSRTFVRGAVVTPHYVASAAGLEVLAAGGNAVDAIVAANLALGVVAPYYCGYGGDLFAIVWDGRLHGYRGAGRSAAGVDPGRLAAEFGEMPVFGPHAVTVPGAVRGWFDLLDRFGTRGFEQLAARAIEFAGDGFVLSRPGAYRIAGSVAMIRAMHPRGSAALDAVYGGHGDGDRLRQPALAATIRALGAAGPDEYYRGPIGASIAATVEEQGGALRASDLAAHEGCWVEPMLVPFAGATVAELPPPTQGVTALEMLALARVAGEGLPGVDRDHLFVEIAKRALEDRDRYVTDPEHMTTDPEWLLSDEHLAARAGDIDRDHALAALPRPAADGGTAYLCAADAEGLCIGLIQSNFTAIGSGVHVADRGINLQNRGSSFSLDPEHVNTLAPSKLPMHTLIPAMVLRDGRPAYVFGTMGGHAQAQVHLQVLTALLVDGIDPQTAVSAPRWAVEPSTAAVGAEARLGSEWCDAMAARGHALRMLRDFDDGVGHAHAIEVLPAGLRAGADPRAESAALGL